MKTILVRISLIIAIIAGVTVSAIHVTHLKTKIESLRVGLTKQTAAREKAEVDQANAQQEARRTAVALKRSVEALEAKTADIVAQAEQIAKLNGESKKLRDERNEALQKLAAYEFSMTPEQVANASRRIKTLEESLAVSEEENVLLVRRVKQLSSLLPNVCGSGPVALPADLNSKVLVFDPKWRFVVLDAGEDQGMVAQGELLLNRAGKLVAKVRVKSVQKNRCIADVLDGWNIAEIMEGDRAIPAYPRS